MKKYLNKIICLLLSFTMLFSVMSAANITAQAYTFGNDIVEYARDYIGCGYVYGHSGPDTFDCSGFVMYVFNHFGISLPHSSREYWNNPTDYGRVIDYNSIDNALPGDIISWNGHVAIYTGGGYVIEAANSKVGVAERKYDLKGWNGNYQVIRIYGVQSEYYISGLPFRDMWNCDGYASYLKYTSIYNSYLKGTNPPYYNEFSPNESLTRAMLVTIIYRMAGEPYNGKNPHGSQTPFEDIGNTGAYFYDASCWALDKGITTEIYFKPYDYVSREETAAFFYRYADISGKITNEDYKNIDLSRYHDYENVRDWALEALQWANQSGMITGTQEGYIDPQGDTKRIHSSKIIYGFGKTYNIGKFK